MTSESNTIKEKKEILFYYESRQNPNGDPGFENQPRMMPDGTIMVTDVRIKRTMRDYAKKIWNETLFVDFDEDGNPVKADERAKDIINPSNNKKKKLEADAIASLLKKTFDVPLFGAFLPIRSDKNRSDEDAGSSQKLTGPLQFGIGRSVNQVQLINPLISSRFVGRETNSAQQFSTFGRFYSVEYALIKIHGALNPENLGKHLNDEEIKKDFTEAESRIFECLWNGTNELVTRSKFPQRSILYIEVIYKNTIYNDLPDLVEENENLKKRTCSLGASPFKFDKLEAMIDEREEKISKIKVKGCPEISEAIDQLINRINSKMANLVEKIAN
jgi:CRISPR-associated protein Csh2